MTDLSNLYCPNCRHQTLHLVREVRAKEQWDGVLIFDGDMKPVLETPEECDEAEYWVWGGDEVLHDPFFECHWCDWKGVLYEIILGNLESFQKKCTSPSYKVNSLAGFQLLVYNTDEQAWDQAWRDIGWGDTQYRKLSFNLVNDQRLQCGLPEYKYEDFKRFLDNLSITED